MVFTSQQFCLGGIPAGGGGRFWPEKVAGIDEFEADG